MALHRDENIPLSFIQTFMGSSHERRPYVHLSSLAFTPKPKKTANKSSRKVTVTTMSSRPLKQQTCIDRSEVKDKKFIHKMMDFLGCSKIDGVCSPIPAFGKKVEHIPGLAIAKRCNEELKEKDLLLHCTHLNHLGEEDDDISCTLSCSLESESGISDLVSMKCQIDEPYQNFEKNDFSLQSTKQTFGSKKSDSFSSMPSDENRFWNKKVEESVDIDGVKSFNLNLRHVFFHHPCARQTSSSERDGVVLASLQHSSADKDDVKDDECTLAFSRVDEPNKRSERRGTFQSLWNTETNTGKIQLQNKEAEISLLKEDKHFSYVQLKAEENQNPTVIVKSHFKRSDENPKENGFCFQSTKQNLVCEQNEAALFMPSCRTLLETRDIDRFCDVVPTKNFKENLRETHYCSQRVEHISSWEGDNSFFSTPSYSHKFDNNLEANEIIPYFDSINEVNGTHRVKDSIPISKEISIVRNWDIDKSAEITLQENKQQSECLYFQKCQNSVSAHITDKKNEIADIKSHAETGEGTDLQIKIKDRICELSNELYYVAGSSHQLEGTDSRSDNKYLRHGRHSKGREYPKHGDLFKESPSRGDREKKMYCNDNEKSLRYETHQLGGFDNEKDSIEQAKSRYFAALVAARKEPGEESLALATQLRSELESCLNVRLFASFLIPPCEQHALGT